MESTPENTASTGIGIAVYPSGIQPCSGNAGIFTRNAAAKNRKIQSCVPAGSVRCASALISKVTDWSPVADSTPVATAALSMSSEPTSV